MPSGLKARHSMLWPNRGLARYRRWPSKSELEVGQPIDVVPLPAAEIDRAALEQVLGQGDVVVLHLAECQGDAVDVVLPPQVLRPFGRLAGLLVGPLALLLWSGPARS